MQTEKDTVTPDVHRLRNNHLSHLRATMIDELSRHGSTVYQQDTYAILEWIIEDMGLYVDKLSPSTYLVSIYPIKG